MENNSETNSKGSTSSEGESFRETSQITTREGEPYNTLDDEDQGNEDTVEGSETHKNLVRDFKSLRF